MFVVCLPRAGCLLTSCVSLSDNDHDNLTLLCASCSTVRGGVVAWSPRWYQQQDPPLHITTSILRWQTKSKNDKCLEITCDCVIMFSPWSTWWWHWSFPPLCLGLMTIPILTRMDTNVYGSFINLKILHSSHSWQYSALQWRHLQICKAASITRCIFKVTCPGYLTT